MPTTTKGYVDAAYLDRTAQLAAQRKADSYALMHLAHGRSALDVGCGPGHDTLALANIVGPAGRVCGLDHDHDMVVLAQQRSVAANAVNVLHVHGDATALPWPDASFDAVRSERMLQHTLQPAAALVQMVRVLKPGGRLVVLDGEWSTLTVDCADAALERRLIRFHCETMINHPHSGRSLRRQFAEHGLTDIAVDVWPVVFTDYAEARRILRLDLIADAARDAGVISAAQWQQWHAALAAAAAIDGFFASTNGVTVSATRPP
jgi:SAM-dependent methyltransferase